MWVKSGIYKILPNEKGNLRTAPETNSHQKRQKNNQKTTYRSYKSNMHAPDHKRLRDEIQSRDV